MAREFMLLGEKIVISDERDKVIRCRKEFLNASRNYKDTCFNELKRYQSEIVSNANNVNIKYLVDGLKTVRGEIGFFIRDKALPLLMDHGIFHIDEDTFYTQYLNTDQFEDIINKIGYDWDNNPDGCDEDWFIDIYNELSVITDSLFGDVFNTAMYLIHKEGDADFETMKKDDVDKAEAILKNIDNIPKANLGKALKQVIQLNIFNPKIYTIPVLYHDKETAKEIGLIANYVGNAEAAFLTVYLLELNWYYSQLKKDDTLKEMDITYRAGVSLIENICTGYNMDCKKNLKRVHEYYYETKGEFIANSILAGKDSDNGLISAAINMLNEMKAPQITDKYVAQIKSYAKEHENDALIDEIEAKLKETNLDKTVSIDEFKKFVLKKNKGRKDNILKPYIENADIYTQACKMKKNPNDIDAIDKFIKFAKGFPENNLAKEYVKKALFNKHNMFAKEYIECIEKLSGTIPAFCYTNMAKNEDIDKLIEHISNNAPFMAEKTINKDDIVVFCKYKNLHNRCCIIVTFDAVYVAAPQKIFVFPFKALKQAPKNVTANYTEKTRFYPNNMLSVDVPAPDIAEVKEVIVGVMAKLWEGRQKIKSNFKTEYNIYYSQL